MTSKEPKYILIYLLCPILFFGCAKQNASIVKQTYNDLTGHYNTYFNGNEIYKQAMLGIENSRTEKYDSIIPLFAYGTLNDTKGQESQFETAIKKAELTVQLHQEKIGGKNYQTDEDNSITNWADDAFLLVGKSYFMTGNYDKAIRSFRYITANFDEAVDGRSKKKIKKQKSNKKRKAKAKKKAKKLIEKEKAGKDIRPSKHLFSHESAKSEALIWLAKTYSAQGSYQEADAVLTYIGSDKTFLKNYDAEVALAKANNQLAQGAVSSAIPHMLEAIKGVKKAKEKSRYQFVLAQLYEATNQNGLAASAYNQSIKGNPNFEMAFYAKFKLIQMSHSDGYDKSEAKKLIAKLLKDSKNRDYQDLLYYEKALFALEEDKREDAKEFLAKSIDRSTVNKEQKAKSYVLLADLNYEEEKYELAQAFYDSTVQIVTPKFENYNFILNRSNVLNELVMHLRTIETNDSVLLIADMSEDDMESYLYDLAVEMVEKEEKAAADRINNLPVTSNSSGKGDKKAWYFYSESAKTSGYKTFQSKWGDRTLEDNWRRSERGNDEITDGEEEGINDNDFFGKVDEQYAFLLAEIPTSDAEKEALRTAIIDAYYGAAVTYRIGLDNSEKAVVMFEKLVQKYPDNVHQLESYYNLYLLHDLLGNSVKAKKYKDLVLNEYPESKFAKVIQDPDYLNQLNAQVAGVLSFYEATYDMYFAGQYDNVIERGEEAKTKFPNNNLQAKFDLLTALSIGAKKLYDPYVASLRSIVQNYKNTEEQEKAEELLAYLLERDEKAKQEKNQERIDAKEKVKKELDGKLIPKNSTKGSTEENEDETEDKDGLKIKFGTKELKVGGSDKLKKGPK